MRKCDVCKLETEDFKEVDDKVICGECQDIDWTKICHECRGSGGNCPSCGGSGHGSKRRGR